MDILKCECGHNHPLGTEICESCGKPFENTKKQELLDMRYEGLARRSQTYKKAIVDQIWNFFSSVKVGICLIIITLIASAVGTVLPQELYIPPSADQKRALLHTDFFLLRFTVIFIVIGFSTSLIGSFFIKHDNLIRQVGSLVIIFFGLVIVGVFKPSFLMKDTKVFSFRNSPSGYLGSSVIGVGFATGWTPCTDPILASVIALAVSNPDQALFYMTMYSLGFSIPFFIMTFFIGKMNWIKKYNQVIIKTGGYIMIFMGIFLLFDWMTKLTSFLASEF
ncbi:cytochrome c biogenesis CcdA family protein [Cytobacillus oceanisediminis]|uniref:cytochrome c biogenesis CcdA family protein n=1 Tax=Cytobacillus oceanisediminis TaxID=665099 RepID=UPI003734CD50